MGNNFCSLCMVKREREQAGLPPLTTFTAGAADYGQGGQGERAIFPSHREERRRQRSLSPVRGIGGSSYRDRIEPKSTPCQYCAITPGLEHKAHTHVQKDCGFLRKPCHHCATTPGLQHKAYTHLHEHCDHINSQSRRSARKRNRNAPSTPQPQGVLLPPPPPPPRPTAATTTQSQLAIPAAVVSTALPPPRAPEGDLARSLRESIELFSQRSEHRGMPPLRVALAYRDELRAAQLKALLGRSNFELPGRLWIALDAYIEYLEAELHSGRSRS